MRRYYKKPYQNSKALAGAPRKKKALQLPEWDSTQHDLNNLKLTPEQLERRHQERISKHHISLAALAARQANRSIMDGHAQEPGAAAEQQQQREQGAPQSSNQDTISLSDGSSSSEDDAQQQRSYQQRYREELAAFRHELEASSDSEDVVLLDIGNQQPQQQQQQQQQGQRQHTKAKLATQPAATARPHDADNSAHAGARQHPNAPTLASMDVGSRSEAFDKQVQELQQQLAEERAASEQLRAELHDYMGHAGSVIAQLQQQMQQLMATGAAASGSSSAQQQQQQAHCAGAHGSSSPTRHGMDTAAAGPSQQPSDRQSDARHSALYPAAWHATPSTAAATAGAGSHYGQSYNSSVAAAAAASLQQRLARVEGEGTAAPQLGVTAEQAVLPSYAEMRRQNAAAVTVGPYAAGLWSAGSPASSPQWRGAQPSNPLRNSTASITDLFSRPVPGPSDRPPHSRPNTASGHDPTATLLLISASPASSQQRWSNAAQAPFLVSSSAAEAVSAAADGQPSPALAANWANSMPGLKDVDRHLGPGLPRTSVARLHAQAHYFEPMPLSQQYLHPAEAWRTLSLNAHVAAARTGREGASAGMR